MGVCVGGCGRRQSEWRFHNLLPASPAEKSAIIFNTAQSDSHTSEPHRNVYSASNTVLPTL